MFKQLIFSGLLGVSALAGTASAQDLPSAQGEARAVLVRHADLNLSERADAEALLSRLRYAAVRACEANAVARPGPQLRRAVEECRTAALEGAIEDANSTQLSQLYSEQRR